MFSVKYPDLGHDPLQAFPYVFNGVEVRRIRRKEYHTYVESAAFSATADERWTAKLYVIMIMGRSSFHLLTDSRKRHMSSFFEEFGNSMTEVPFMA